MAYTKAQLELKAHLETEKVRIQAWVAEDPQNRFAGYPTTDLDHWAGNNVFSIEDYKLYNLRCDIWDLYKETHGVRPRHMNLNEMTADELNKTYDSLISEKDAA